MSITEFLLERIAEDEYEANVCLDQYRRGDGGSTPRWTRQLAECAAKRAIVEMHAPVDYSGLGMESPNACTLCGADRGMHDWEWMKDSFPCDTLRTLAAVYADHPGYLDEWRVGE